MRYAREGSDCASTCELKCKNIKTGERYEWQWENGLKKCTCPVCLCNCRKVYKLDNIQGIMGELARMDVSLNADGDVEENSVKKREMEAQDYINKSLAYGFKPGQSMVQLWKN